MASTVRYPELKPVRRADFTGNCDRCGASLWIIDGSTHAPAGTVATRTETCGCAPGVEVILTETA